MATTYFKNARAVALLLVALVCASFLLMLLIGLPGIARMSLGNGGSVIVTSPPLLKAIGGATCRIEYRTPAAGKGDIVLWRDFVNIPILIMADVTNGAFFCLYHFDTDLRLLRIDPSHKFTRFPSENWSCLKNVVCSSTAGIKEANLSEWQRAFEILDRMSSGQFKQQRIPIYDLHLFSFGMGIHDVHRDMEFQIHAMETAGSDQWPIIISRR
jgi:hypothetical protein